jgi:serine phosphatase RsbU (regulator of sigma subunit)
MPAAHDTTSSRLQDVATMACHGVPGCDAASISVPSGAAVLTLGATSDDASHVDDVQYATGDGPCLSALREGVVVRVDDYTSERRWPALARAALAAGFRSSLSMPLRHGDRLFGSLNMHARRAGAFDERSERVGDVLARQAAGVLSDAESAARTGAARLAERRIVQTLQRDLVPALPVLPGITTAMRYLAAEPGAEVGGDWYDVFALPQDAIGVAIGDVVGHDVAAAARMNQLRSVLRSYACEGSSPCEVLDQLDHLVQSFDMGLATAVYGTLRLHRDGAVLTYGSAGHVPPLVRDPDGVVRELSDGASWLIGVPSSGLGGRTDATTSLPTGSTLVLYTDGLVERRRHHLDEGIDRLAAALSGPLGDSGPEALCDRVLDRMVDDGCTDDLALLVLRVDG